MRILIAEDDCVARRVLERALEKRGYEVIVAKDGIQAWDILQSDNAPNLAVLDWMMPGMDGLEVCQKLRAKEHAIHPYVILLTGKDRKKDLIHGFEAGADDYIRKPFDTDELSVRVRAGERIINLQIEGAVALDSLRKQTTRDSLTGVLNRATILNELTREFDRNPRTGKPTAVAMVDLDKFKAINDTYGHPVGDRVLAETAKRMASEVRSYEAVGRYGGEEFLIILSGCDTEGASSMAKRICDSVAAEEFIVPGAKLTVTASFGVACTEQFMEPTEAGLIRAADMALYRAKDNGRNQVQVANLQEGGLCKKNEAADQPSMVSKFSRTGIMPGGLLEATTLPIGANCDPAPPEKPIGT